MLSELCLCGLVLFADPGWSKLDTSFLDMDPPLMSWSVTDAEYNEWENKENEHAKYFWLPLGQEVDTRWVKRNRDNALQMVRDRCPGDMGLSLGAHRTFPALAR